MLHLCVMIFKRFGERPFSALKTEKNHIMLSFMAQKRLNSLALLCIQNELLERIDANYSTSLRALFWLNPENVSFE